MTGPTGSFDANQYEPQQTAGSKHPLGSFPFQISNTSIQESKDKTSGMFVIEFTSPAGTIEKRYNLWHENPQTVEIAQKQLSALCHATGVYRLDWQNQGAALRGARGTMEVGDQIDKQTKQPNGYVEVKKVFDVQGNEPGKPQQASPQTQQQPAGNGSWQQPAQPQANAPANQAPQGWSAPSNANPGSGTGGAPANAPPWAR